MTTRTLGACLVLFAAQAVAADIPRTADGRPDLSGHYDTATQTPLERPEDLGDKLYLSTEEARAYTAARKARLEDLEAQKDDDPNRGAPPKGGDGNYILGAGGVGGYNTGWIDNGEFVFAIDGRYRTSIIHEPANGRMPGYVAAAGHRLAKKYGHFSKPNTGTAWWLAEKGPGPYDGPESRTTSDRCLAGFGSTGGPPMLPVLYNNMKRIVQTPGHVMILVEMVHDARIVRLDSEHVDPSIRKWMGDSIGWWEGDTLVVDTTNFNDDPGLGQATRDLHVVERFTPMENGDLLYQFTVEDPNTWQAPWSGEYPWPRSDNVVYEYACHEANYAMGNILRGARLLESEWQGPRAD
jgi:hypothetical protein